MIYPHNFEQKIGFDTIRELTAARCLSPLGEEKVKAMAFSSHYETIRKQLYRTDEFVQILREEDRFPSDHFLDVRDSLKKIRIEGTYLLKNELFDIRRSLETINAIVLFFRSKEELYPYLQELTGNTATFPKHTKQIDTILDKYGEIKDNASPELSNIRKQLAQTVNSISKILNGILRTAQSEGLVEKDVAPTMRDGRLVIPISPAFKRKLKGIVHDESASGKTVFIEPTEVVEANNKIRELESEEKREIVRILTAVTNQIRPEIPEILQSYLFLAEIDFIRAKALLATDIEAVLPIIEDNRQIDWMRAIHPLLYLSHKKRNKPVVPLDIELRNTVQGSGYKVQGSGYKVQGKRESEINREPCTLDPEPRTIKSGRILLVSGPNAGGKSVLLKTVGLLQYMLQCGMLIPVRDHSHTGIFSDIFIDIGDEQSIENDLSTYSSHLTGMNFMIKNANPRSLILIDELGSGTEPQIGGAIAEALLHRLNEKQSFGVITTHYQNLKTFAESHEGVINGAMLFDRQKMQPLFILSVGQPGSSFAIEIARKIGLPEEVIAEASEIVGKDYLDMDKYLQDIIRDKRYWESKRQNIRKQEKRLEELNEQYQARLEKIESQRKEIIAQAKTDAERMLSDTNAIIEKTIRDIKEAKAEKEKTKEVRKTLDDFKQSVTQGAGYKHPSPVSPIGIGDIVRIKGQQVAGQVMEIKDKTVIVAFGALKTSVKPEQLEKTDNNQPKRETASASTMLANSADTLSEKKLHFKPEIDIRGMRGDEALQAVTYYIDDAIQCNAGRVRILHGTGTGALRQIIREYLKTVQGIKNYHDEHVQLGGTGITVVELE